MYLYRLIAVSLGFRRCCFIRGIGGCILQIRDRSVGDPLFTRASKQLAEHRCHLVEELSMHYINCEDGFSLSQRTMLICMKTMSFISKPYVRILRCYKNKSCHCHCNASG